MFANCPFSKPDESNRRDNTQSDFFKIHYNLIFPSVPGSTKWSVSCSFRHQNSVCVFLISHMCRIYRPSHPPRFSRPNNMWWGANIMGLIMLFSAANCYFLWGPNIFLSAVFSNPRPILFRYCERSTFIPIETTDKITVVYILILMFLGGNGPACCIQKMWFDSCASTDT